LGLRRSAGTGEGRGAIKLLGKHEDVHGKHGSDASEDRLIELAGLAVSLDVHGLNLVDAMPERQLFMLQQAPCQTSKPANFRGFRCNSTNDIW
jgi:hypothetical protein